MAALVLTDEHGSRATGTRPVAPARTGTLRVTPLLSVVAGQVERRGLPRTAWVASFDLLLRPGSSLTLALGSSRRRVVLTRDHGGASPRLAYGGRSYALTSPPDWRADGPWRHFEVRGGAGGGVSVDGRSLPGVAASGGRLAFRSSRGSAAVRALIISAAADRGSLLLHRLSELHARVRPGAWLLGADGRDRLYLHSMWTSGFWPGALWQAAALAGEPFRGWALHATLADLGHERAPTHDVGFIYGQSSLQAYQAVCRGGLARAALCSRLRRSVVAASRELVALAATNPGAATIPTNPGSNPAETIVDSMMNIGILPWATRFTHNPSFVRLALHQAQVIASLLVRSDGSTIQAIHFDRSTGRIQYIGTHQGLSSSSTWSRGQGWALYGFAELAAQLRNRDLLSVAERLADYVAEHLPPGGVPLWDYNAPPGAPVDVSAGVITATGLLRLAGACRQLPDVCSDPGRWVSLARTMLAGALSLASGDPPLGFLGSEVLNVHRQDCCNGGELIFGLSYALEALRLERSAGYT